MHWLNISARCGPYTTDRVQWVRRMPEAQARLYFLHLKILKKEMVKKVPRFTLAISITLLNTRCPPTALYKNTIKTLPNRMAASGTFKRELLKSKYWRSASCSLDFDWRRRREGRMSFKAAWKIQIKLPFIFSVDLVLNETSRIPALLLRYYSFKLFNKASETIKLPCVYTKLRCNGFHAGHTLQIFPKVTPHICMSHVSCFPALSTGCIFFPRFSSCTFSRA